MGACQLACGCSSGGEWMLVRWHGCSSGGKDARRSQLVCGCLSSVGVGARQLTWVHFVGIKVGFIQFYTVLYGFFGFLFSISVWAS